MAAATAEHQLERRVECLVRRVISERPDNLRSLAEDVPVFCEWEMAQRWRDEGVATSTP